MTKLEPMLLTDASGDFSALEKNWLFQIKYDGERCFAHIKQGKITALVSRSGTPMIYRFPELRELQFDFDTAILDCEVCVLVNGRTDFGTIQKRRSEPTQAVMQQYPITLVVFDLIYFDGKLVTNRSCKARYEMLQTIVKDGKNVVLARCHTDGKALWEEVKVKNLEGLVIKNPDATYELGKRVKHQLKFKYYKEADVLVERVEANTAGSKIYGKAKIEDGREIIVECQIPSEIVTVGSIKKIKYLEVTKDNKLRMPHRA